MGRRTHVTLTDAQHEFLAEEARRTGLSMAELIRRSLDLAFRPEERPRVGGFELSFGLWRRPDAALTGRRKKP
jgi:hypothetical protein